ncbi:MAG: hypothetical protein HZB38_14175 [Planctomycetes bacterium]|nr:hypothetical protein [Planctomycetota bacterium]
MPEHSVEVRSVRWAEVTPITRLFGTIWRALAFGPLGVGLLFVACTYLIGRLLDWVWVFGGHGVLAAAIASSPSGAAHVPTAGDEIRAYATLDAATFDTWREFARAAAVSAEPAPKEDIEAALNLVDERESKGRAAIAAHQQPSAAEKHLKAAALRRMADTVRFALRGCAEHPYPGVSASAALERVLAADPAITVGQRGEETQRLGRLLERVRADVTRRQQAARGPFASLLHYEMRCMAGAVHGVMNGRWGMQAGGLDHDPALAGSVVTSAKGILWLATQRPFYAALFGVLVLLVGAPLLGTICRLTAITVAREELPEFNPAFAFMRRRYAALVGAPLACVGLVLGICLLLAIGGIVGAIPYIGPLLSGLTFFLAIFGGAAAAFFLLLLIVGFPMMWPTIAVEGSDTFDALQRSCAYMFQRHGLAALCFSLLSLVGGVYLLAARVVAVLVLKLTHDGIGAGMNLLRSSSETSTIGRLDAMWWMPKWQDLSLLPSLDGPPMWGVIGYAPMSGSEAVGAFLIGLWVFLIVALVAAFAMSYFFAGATETYFILRQAEDNVPAAEICYEEQTDEITGESAGPAAIGTPLPIVNGPN